MFYLCKSQFWGEQSLFQFPILSHWLSLNVLIGRGSPGVHLMSETEWGGTTLLTWITAMVLVSKFLCFKYSFTKVANSNPDWSSNAISISWLSFCKSLSRTHPPATLNIVDLLLLFTTSSSKVNNSSSWSVNCIILVIEYACKVSLFLWQMKEIWRKRPLTGNLYGLPADRAVRQRKQLRQLLLP